MLKTFWVCQFCGAIQKDGRKYKEPHIIEVEEKRVQIYGNTKYVYVEDGYSLRVFETEEECRNALKEYINQHLKYLEEKKMLILKYEMKLFERLAKI